MTRARATICRDCGVALDPERPRRHGRRCRECKLASKLACYRASHQDPDKHERTKSRKRASRAARRLANPVGLWAANGCWNTRTRAKHRSLEHTLTSAHLEALAASTLACPLHANAKPFRFDLPALAKGIQFAQVRPSLDRIDSDGGYTPDNVRLICNDCNMKKNALDVRIIAYYLSGMGLRIVRDKRGPHRDHGRNRQHEMWGDDDG